MSEEEDKLVKNGKLFNAIRNKKTMEEKLIKIQKYLKEGADINATDANNKNNTPLHVAVLKGQTGVVELLLTREAVTSHRNTDGLTPLDIAKQPGTPKGQEIVNIIEKHLGNFEQDSARSNLGEKSELQDQLVSLCNKVTLERQQKEIKRPGKQGLHGEIYQLKLLILFLKRGVDNHYSFRLGTERPEAKKFDDLFFEINTNGRKEYRLLQAKHKDDESKRITFENLLTQSDGDYSLVKYFFSYQDSKKEKLFKNGTIKDVIVCTNIGMDLENTYKLNSDSKTLREVVSRINEKDDILDIGNSTLPKEAIRYQFNDGITPFLKPELESYNLTRLAKRLSECLLKNSSIQHHQQQDIFRHYHGALAEDVINIKSKNFHDKFVNGTGISKEAWKYRKVFADEVKKQSKGLLTLEDVNQAISDRKVIDGKVIGLNLSKKFGIGGDNAWPNNTISDNDIRDFLQHLVFAVDQPNEQQLGRIIEDDTGREFNFSARDYVYNNLFVRMLDWLNGKGSEFISHEDGNQFFKQAKQALSELELTGLVQDCRLKIEKLGILFNSAAVEEIGLNDFLESKDLGRLFNIVTPQSTLTFIKVYQVLREFEENYIFMPLESIFHLEDRVVGTFRGNVNLLVIECNTTEEKENIQRLYTVLSKIILNSKNKKIIFISRKDDSLCDKFKSNMECNYREKMDERNRFIDLDFETQNKLLQQQKIMFQNKEVNLTSLIDQESACLINAEILSKLISNETMLNIGKALTTLGKVQHCYMDRTFNQQIIIRTECFQEENIPDLFTVSSDDNEELSSLANKENDQFVIIEGEGDLKKLCQRYPDRPLHWLKKVNGDLIWQQSYGSLTGLRKFIDSSRTINYQPVNIHSISNRIVILSAEPGMGKSTVLTKLALETKHDPSLWVERINLNDHTKSLDKENFDNVDKAVDFLLKIMDFKTPLETHFFKHRMTSQGKIILLFDGFDEVSPTYSDKVIELLNLLKKTKAEKLWITTRLHMRIELEDKLRTLSYTLKPLSRLDQNELLRKLWGKQSDDVRSNNYIEGLLNVLSHSIADKEVEFTGIPLQTTMLSEVFHDKFKEFYTSNRIEPNLPKKLDLVDLYHQFIDKKYNIYWKEKKKDDLTKPSVQRDYEKLRKYFMSDHEILALSVLFSDKDLQFILKKKHKRLIQLRSEVDGGYEKTGIVNQIVNDRPTFIHRTFAEYFAASWFVSRTDKMEFNDFLRHNLFKGENSVLCNFFDRLLAYSTHDKNKFELHVAVLNNDEPMVKSLLNDQTNPNSLDKGGRTALHLASRYGYWGIVKILLENGADIKTRDKIFKWSPLSYADKNSHWRIVELLLEKRADSNDLYEATKTIKDFNGRKETVIHIAAKENYENIAGVLLSKEPNCVDFKDENGKTPLHLSSEHGHLNIVKLLVECGAAINLNTSVGPPQRRSPLNWTPLHWAALGDHVDVVEYFLSKNVNIVEDSNGSTPVLVAIWRGHLDVVKVLGGTESDVLHAAVASDNLTLVKRLTKRENFSKLKDPGILNTAASSGSLKVIQFLIQNGAGIDGDNSDFAPLAIAAGRGHLKVVKYLVEQGADIERREIDGWTPLLASSRSSSSENDLTDESKFLEVVKYFIEEKGANINVVDKKGTTPLQTAAHHNRLEIVKYLVGKGANIDAVDKVGATIVFSAAFNNNVNIVRFLLGKGAKVDSDEGLLGKHHIKVLHLAAMYDELKLVQLLINKGIDVNSGRGISFTPLHLAAIANSEQTIKYLIDQGADVDASINFSNIFKILVDEESILKGTSMSVLTKRLAGLLPNILKIMIKVTPNIASKFFGYKNEFLEKRSNSSWINEIMLWFAQSISHFGNKQMEMLQTFIEDRKTGNIRPTPQQFVLYMPDHAQQDICEVIEE